MRCLPQCVQLDWISAMLVGVQQQNHTMIWLFLAAGFRIPVLLSSLQWNALWHLFGAGVGLFAGKKMCFKVSTQACLNTGLDELTLDNF